MKSSSSVRLLVLVFMLIGLFLRVGAGMKFPNVNHTDEILETQEPAHHLAYGYSVVAWEWRQGARSWVFPAFLAGVMRSTDWMGSGSAGYQWGMTIVLSLLSLTTVWFGFAWAKRASGTEAAIIAAGACAIWPELVYFAPKTLTEVVATHALLPGLYLGMYGEGLGERKRMFLAGILSGLAMSLRIQLAPAVGFAALYFCYPNWRKRMLPLAAGLLLPVVAFGMVDAVTWSHPFQSFLVYYQVHAKEFSVPSLPSTDAAEGAPNVATWYWYLKMLCAHLGPVAFLVLVGIRRSPFLGWVALIHLVFHSLFSFRAVRYLYPLVPLEITLVAIGLIELAPAFNSRRRSPLAPRTMVGGGLAFLALSSCLLVSQFNWSQRSGCLIAFDQLSRDSTLCGVGVFKIPWWSLGGYAHLHQNVPIVLHGEAPELKEQLTSFNAVLVHGTLTDPSHTLALAGCWNGVCLYRRPGPCAPPRADNEINSVLRRNGW
jgi:phosphatidylinositol glycan class B